jgi:CheY-like chemotaxis protein
MSQLQLARLFQPFEQLADVDHREGGTGLGLAISRQLVRLMGGDIHVSSVPGQGSVFSFEIELPVVEAGARAVPERGLPVSYQGLRKSVLVVDDVAQNRAMLLDALGVLGFDVQEAADGAECVEMARSMRPDLIVMDTMMPVMDGYEATRRIRLMPGLADVPIIATSASATQEVDALCRKAGANLFIPKPIEQAQLLDAMGRLLGLHWVYADPPPRVSAVVDGDIPDASIPPSQEMAELRRLARTGNMRVIRDWAERMKATDARYAPFATRLAALAEGCQSKAIAALVERYSEESEAG